MSLEAVCLLLAVVDTGQAAGILAAALPEEQFVVFEVKPAVPGYSPVHWRKAMKLNLPMLLFAAWQPYRGYSLLQSVARVRRSGDRGPR